MSGVSQSFGKATAPREDASDGKIVHVTVKEAGVAFVTLNDPRAPLNTITPRLGMELAAAIDRIESDNAIVAAVLVSGKKDSFVVGANIDMLKAMKFATDAERMAKELALALVRLSSLDKPLVAAVHGPALGGGFELALACHAIVMTDDSEQRDGKTVVGLPEVKLGLMPAANGMLRVAERAGLRLAIDLALTGKSVRPAKAKALGLVDAVCAPAILHEVATKLALSLVGKAPKSRVDARGSRGALAFALEENPIGRAVLFHKARKETRSKTHGHYPATERILDVLERYGQKGFASAAGLEAKYFGELVVSETAHRLIEIFFATTALKKDTGIDDVSVSPRAIEHVTVLGGGLMGAGIAYVTSQAGIAVRLKDKDDAGVGRGLAYVRGILDERVKKKQLTPLERDKTFSLITATTDFSGMKHTGVVIEAVFEDLALKQAILRDVEANTGDDCIFASNTSSIPIGKIAQASKHPETVVGMHYFSPVHKMPLLEVIRTGETAPWVIATAVHLGKKQGKTVIVVKDGVGFYTSRILGPYMNEASYLLADGVAIEAIDQALIDWGFPVGPIQLLDEVGIDVAAHVGEIVHAAFGDRMAPPPGIGKLLADDRKGRKNGRGFYLYEKSPASGGGAGSKSASAGGRHVDPSIYATLGLASRSKASPSRATKVPLPREEIQMRCALQMVNEALHCYGEGILRSPRDGDIGAVFGLGFPPFRGGPLRYVDSIGAAEALRRVQGYADRFGLRWAPAPVLVDMAKKGTRFYE